MTTSAWIFMSIVWAIILIMTVYCFVKLLRSRQFHETEQQAQRDDVTPAFSPKE